MAEVTEKPFAERVRMELATARNQHKPISSLHEGYALIKAELDEFWEKAKKDLVCRDKGEVVKELVQIGAMAQRVAEDLRLPANAYEPRPVE